MTKIKKLYISCAWYQVLECGVFNIASPRGAKMPPELFLQKTPPGSIVNPPGVPFYVLAQSQRRLEGCLLALLWYPSARSYARFRVTHPQQYLGYKSSSLLDA